MIRFFISILFLFCSQLIFAQDSISVLFIGNSYTYVNDLPSLLNTLTVSKGDKLTFDSQTQGGATFNNHSLNAAVYSKIHSKPWDYVVLQGQSQELSFSESQVNNQSLPFVKQISDSIYNSKYCTDLMLFMTWGYINGDFQWEPISTYNGMQERLRNGYQRIADSVQASVSPVGMAWKYVRENHPTINLYAGDGSHPSAEGSYLAACTFYASLFRKTPVGATFFGTLPQPIAEQLQHAAEVAVLDSLSLWHLRAFENHTVSAFILSQAGEQVSFINNSWKAQSFNWNFGDGFSSVEINPTHTYSVNGNFPVSLDAISECNVDQSNENLDVTTVGLKDFDKSSLKLYSYSNGKFNVTGEEIDEGSIYLRDLNGKLITNWVLEQNNLSIDLSNQSPGQYYLNINKTSITIIR